MEERLTKPEAIEMARKRYGETRQDFLLNLFFDFMKLMALNIPCVLLNVHKGDLDSAYSVCSLLSLAIVVYWNGVKANERHLCEATYIQSVLLSDQPPESDT